METSASFEARSAPSPYPTTMETAASFEARFRAIVLPDREQQRLVAICRDSSNEATNQRRGELDGIGE
jgi:hypothetical protein